MDHVAVKSHGSQKKTNGKVPCPECGAMVKLKNLASHRTKKCPKRDPQARKNLHAKPPAQPQPVRTVHETVPSRRFAEAGTWFW